MMTRERYLELLNQFAKKRVLVVGDFILDEYLLGDTKRVSREAPVVVIDYRESVSHPGGAANAVQNVAALNGHAYACGVIGDDDYGRILREILDGRGADTTGLVETAEISTAVKSRILAGELHAQRQQVARIDRSYRITPSSPAIEEVGRRVAGKMDNADVVLISDYGMGIVPGAVSASVIAASRERNIPVVVDSRRELTSYVGASVGTPNEVELFDAMNVKKTETPDLVAIAKRAIRETHLDGLVITRGNRGMLVCDAEGSVQRIGIVGTRDVTDVTGAGDTVAAVVALSLSSGASLVEAAEMATYAASIVVMKRGTATMTYDELVAARKNNPTPRETDFE
jgi:rfaE bifunctional protein kinase chain/domain